MHSERSERSGDRERLPEQLRRLEEQSQQLREQLLRAARRATVASLAQQLTHDINNALTPIVGNAQLLALRAEPGSETAERAEQIMAHAKRIASLTASFRQVTQGSGDQVVPFSFNGIVQDTLEFYGERFERLGIQVELALDDALPVVEGHPDQIQEVMLNLIQNALESMPHGGALEVRTSYAEDQARVQAQVSDTGSGIAPEHFDQIFEPGFSTKRVDSQAFGSGWGLFTAKHLVEAHGGELVIESQPEQGTRVHLMLPISSG